MEPIRLTAWASRLPILWLPFPGAVLMAGSVDGTGGCWLPSAHGGKDQRVTESLDQIRLLLEKKDEA